MQVVVFAGDGWEDFLQQVERWRPDGLVTTNGCFDGLHGGHLAVLDAPRPLGSRLIVGLNSDASVKALKGEDRPLHPEKSRAQTLLGLRSVDAVVIFSDLLPLRFLEAIRAPIHRKGGDYQADLLPETQVVQQWGGRIEIVEPVRFLSSTGGLGKGNDLLEDFLGTASLLRQAGFAHHQTLQQWADQLRRFPQRRVFVDFCSETDFFQPYAPDQERPGDTLWLDAGADESILLEKAAAARSRGVFVVVLGPGGALEKQVNIYLKVSETRNSRLRVLQRAFLDFLMQELGR